MPSFSIVIETLNVAAAEPFRLAACLASLDRQDRSPATAREVLLMALPALPARLLDEVPAAYAWLTVVPVAAGTGYHTMKQIGASRASGEIVVLCDSDCVYAPAWLGTLLDTFRPGVDAVAGETTTAVESAWDLAQAIAFVFPRYTGETLARPASYYFANNAAFRRWVFAEHPLPTAVPLYRAQSVLHTETLAHAGCTLWRQPRARALHPVPRTWREFALVHVLMGHDALTRVDLRRQDIGGSPPGAWNLLRLVAGRIKGLAARGAALLAEDPRRLGQFLVALPIVAAAFLAFVAGMGAGWLRPSSLENWLDHEGPEAPRRCRG